MFLLVCAVVRCFGLLYRTGVDVYVCLCEAFCACLRLLRSGSLHQLQPVRNTSWVRTSGGYKRGSTCSTRLGHGSRWAGGTGADGLMGADAMGPDDDNHHNSLIYD
jgi:hypothetical protein